MLRSYWEMATYALMGAALGVLAAGYIRFFNATEAWFRRLNLPVWVKLEAGLAVVGVIAIWLPQNLSDGYPVINGAMAGEFGIGMLAALTCAKIFASSVSLGCGAPGGSFGPTFFIGTMAGGLFQRVSAMVIPHLTGPRGSYALVGLGAFLAGTTHAPLTALFLLWEMTHSDTIALPSMIATITALVVARAIETESIDEFRLAREGKTLQIGRERLALALIPVSAVVTKNVTIVTENTSLTEVLRTAGETAQSTLPVSTATANFVGTIVVRDLLIVIGARAGARSARERLRHLQCARSDRAARRESRRGEPVDGARRSRRDSGGRAPSPGVFSGSSPAGKLRKPSIAYRFRSRRSPRATPISTGRPAIA